MQLIKTPNLGFKWLASENPSNKSTQLRPNNAWFAMKFERRIKQHVLSSRRGLRNVRDLSGLSDLLGLSCLSDCVVYLVRCLVRLA